MATSAIPAAVPTSDSVAAVLPDSVGLAGEWRQYVLSGRVFDGPAPNLTPREWAMHHFMGPFIKTLHESEATVEQVVIARNGATENKLVNGRLRRHADGSVSCDNDTTYWGSISEDGQFMVATLTRPTSAPALVLMIRCPAGSLPPIPVGHWQTHELNLNSDPNGEFDWTYWNRNRLAIAPDGRIEWDFSHDTRPRTVYTATVLTDSGDSHGLLSRQQYTVAPNGELFVYARYNPELGLALKLTEEHKPDMLTGNWMVHAVTADKYGAFKWWRGQVNIDGRGQTSGSCADSNGNQVNPRLGGLKLADDGEITMRLPTGEFAGTMTASGNCIVATRTTSDGDYELLIMVRQGNNNEHGASEVMP